MENQENFESVQKLIGLKRYETPGEDYFERFIDEFHQRQQAELLKIPAHRRVLDRRNTWLDNWHGHRWRSAAGGAAFAACVAVIMTVSQGPEPTEIAQVEQPTEIVETNPLLKEF